ncbi:MAG: recombinase family protein [Pseudomonadota bacterium]
MTDYVAYLRVSTSKQYRSGLGLAAQRSTIGSFLSDGDVIIAEFVEARSGTKTDRKELWKALAAAKRHSADLVIAKLDRFSRRVSFISRIMDEGVRLVVADMPTATDFQLHIFAALAQEERRLVSERTRAALAEAKRQGVVLGRNGSVLAAQHRADADKFARDLAPTIKPLLKLGMSYSAIARELNLAGVQTARGGQFHSQTVKNLAVRIDAP